MSLLFVELRLIVNLHLKLALPLHCVRQSNDCLIRFCAIWRLFINALFWNRLFSRRDLIANKWLVLVSKR